MSLDERLSHHGGREGHEDRNLKKMFSSFVLFVCSFENTGRRGLDQFKAEPSIASFQHGVLESRLTWMFPDASLQTWMPAIHAGMTKICIFCSVGERKIMNHFVVISMFLLIAALRTPGLCGEDFFTLNPEEPQFEYVSIICPRQD